MQKFGLMCRNTPIDSPQEKRLENMKFMKEVKIFTQMGVDYNDQEEKFLQVMSWAKQFDAQQDRDDWLWYVYENGVEEEGK